MARLTRCDELITRFRMRLGEPTEGTFGRTYYDGVRDNIDELRFILNDAQRHFTWLCYSANLSLIETSVFLSVLAGADRYTMPEEFIAPVKVFHRRASQEYEVTEENLLEIRSRNRVSHYNYHYEFYQIREKVPLILAQGVINQVDSENALRIIDPDIENARLGDIVYNLSDSSQGIVGTVNSDGVTVDKLVNGSANKFVRGDTYQIDTKEKLQDAIELYPTVSPSDTEALNVGRPTGWTVNADHVVHSVCCYISSLPSNLEADDRFICQLVHEDSVIGDGAVVGLDTGRNDFPFVEVVQIREDTEYSVRVVRADGDQTIDVDSIEIVVHLDPESLEVRFASYPRIMQKDSDYCEMPEFSLEGTLAYGHVIAHQKKTGGRPDPGLLAVVEQQKMECKKFQFARDERGPHSVMPVLDGNRYSGSPFPGNYSRGFVDPFDIL